jgi:hypothetical protein
LRRTRSAASRAVLMGMPRDGDFCLLPGRPASSAWQRGAPRRLRVVLLR